MIRILMDFSISYISDIVVVDYVSVIAVMLI